MLQCFLVCLFSGSGKEYSIAVIPPSSADILRPQGPPGPCFQIETFSWCSDDQDDVDIDRIEPDDAVVFGNLRLLGTLNTLRVERRLTHQLLGRVNKNYTITLHCIS